MTRSCLAAIFILFLIASASIPLRSQTDLHVTSHEVLETHGLSVLLFHNSYHRVFGDQKMSGLEIILQDQRIATNGDVRLSPTPAQWDPIPDFEARKRGPAPDEVTASCKYPEQGLSYRIDVRPEAGGFRMAVQLDRAVPDSLAGKAGLNLEFLPSLYFGKSYVAGNSTGIFPRHADGPMEKTADSKIEPSPIAQGESIVLSPEEPSTRVAIRSESGPILLFDGRNQAQNGWFVVRTLIPSGKTGDVIVWHIHPNMVAGWTRRPVIGYNQVGYTPEREKIAVIELDPLFEAPKAARLLGLTPDGEWREALSGSVRPWGKWMRYDYAEFDFSSAREPGIYCIEYAGQKSGPFRIAPNLYDGIWNLSLNTYLPEQMDHVKVREGYRTWHGASHLDDARQAPVNYTHFDGYKQGPTTDSPFSAGQHIPGLNVGGWFDAGDFDLRTQTQTRVIMDLVAAKEEFGVSSDDTTIDEDARDVQMRKPDGIPDLEQQIRHGVLLLLAEHNAIGHAIPGVIEPTLEEYTYLGDAASKTDGRIYSERMGQLENDGIYSGMPDDRWAFTTHTTALAYDEVGALAAASRVLRRVDDKMAEECLQLAEKVWNEEHKQPPALFQYFNTTGSNLQHAELEAAVELLMSTHGGDAYRQRLKEMMPLIKEHFSFLGGTAARAIPSMDDQFKKNIAEALASYKPKLQQMLAQNPYGVPISTGTWGGAGAVTQFATEMFLLHQAFPETIGPEYTLHALDYVLGRHPVSNVSYVSGVGAQSKLIAYGNNRADYTFVPGGIIPGVVIIQPDFPELKEGWPFLWYENEYVVDTVTSYVLAANAAHAETESAK
jgi:endoglucanase